MSVKYRILSYWGRYIAQVRFLGLWLNYTRSDTYKTPDDAEDAVRSNELRKQRTGLVVREFEI